MQLFLLTLASFLTSAVTAMAGMGGGILLLAVLPFLIPPSAIIPVHGLVQLASNSSRFLLGLQYACIRPILTFIAGALIGALAGALFLDKVNAGLIPLFTSFFILLIVWLPIQTLLQKIPGKYFTLGIFQTAISLYAGATGPLSISVLMTENYNSNQVVVSNAAINGLVHLFKSVVFFLSGFMFQAYLPHILSMCVFSVLGSFVGIKLRVYITEEYALKILKIIITLFCSVTIYRFFA